MNSNINVNLDETITIKGVMTDEQVVERIFEHLDHKTTDMGSTTWQEPTEHYQSEGRFEAEYALLQKTPLMMCPSAAIPKHGSYIARDVQGIPLVVVRDKNGEAKTFRNACRHRGVKVASGSGRKTSFVCPYHAWTYGTDGALKVIPHEYGFPQINKCAKSLVPVKTVETQGMIFVCIDEESQIDTLSVLPELIPEGYRLYGETKVELAANWKTIIESFIEGYHIKATHPKSFFPVQYDNLNVIEHFGPHNRVCYPYRSVERLRGRPRSQWVADNKLTYVYQLFPNIIVSNSSRI